MAFDQDGDNDQTSKMVFEELPIPGEMSGQPGGADLLEVLKELGVLGGGETLTLDPTTGRLEVKAGSGTMELFDALVQMSMEDQPVRLSYQLTQQIEGESLSLPKITALPGQEATLEIGKEYLGIQGDEWLTTFVGVKLNLTGELYGFGQKTSVFYERTNTPSALEIAAFEKSGRLEDLDLEGVGASTSVTETLKDRREKGGVEFPLLRDELRFTSQRIDVTGSLIEGP